MISYLIIFLIFLGLSAFFSGTEMAFVSCNDLEVRKEAEDGNKAAQKAIKLLDKPQAFLTAILIGNNIVNIAAASLLTYVLTVEYGLQSEWLVTAIMTPILIVFGEMAPKEYCHIHATQVLLRYAHFFSAFTVFLRIPIRVILKIMNSILDILGVGKDKSIFVSENEFRAVIEESTQKGVIEHHEKQLIDMILDFERSQVKSVMTPLEDAPKVSITKTVKKVREIAKKERTQMVIVYEEIPTIVVGTINVFDLLFEEDEDKKLGEYLRSPVFLEESTTLESAFLTLQQRRQSYAVVTDRFKEVQGVVPIEKLLAVDK